MNEVGPSASVHADWRRIEGKPFSLQEPLHTRCERAALQVGGESNLSSILFDPSDTFRCRIPAVHTGWVISLHRCGIIVAVASPSDTRQASRFVVLLRGINVGGHAKLPMAQLREICTGLGCTDVRTYIQSGNAAMTTTLAADNLAAKLTEAIQTAAGFAPAVVVRTPEELATIIASHPFEGEEQTLHVGFLSAEPQKSAADEVAAVRFGDDRCVVSGRELYLRLPNGLGRSKLAAYPFSRKLGVEVTVRNWRTVLKLAELGSDAASRSD